MSLSAIFLTGFEHGLAAIDGGGLFSTLTGSPTINGTLPRHGSYALEVNAAASTAVFAQTSFAANGKVVARVAVNVRTLPSSSVAALFSVRGTGSAVVSIDSTGLLTAAIGGGTAVNGSIISTNAWHIIEIQLDGTVSGAWTMDWKINGSPQTQAVGTTAGTGTFSSIMWGDNSTTHQAHHVFYDDTIVGTWTVAATDWYGDGKTLGQVAGSDGTHTYTSTHAQKGDTGGAAITSATTDAYTMVSALPFSTRSTTTNISLHNTAAEYAEIKPTTTAESGSANGVRAIQGYSSPVTPVQAGCVVRNSAGTAVVLRGDLPTGSGGNNGLTSSYAVTTNNFIGAMVAVPGAGWTASEVNAIRWRFGSNNSNTNYSTTQSLMLEVDWPLTFGPTSVDAPPANAIAAISPPIIGRGYTTVASVATKIGQAQTFDSGDNFVPVEGSLLVAWIAYAEPSGVGTSVASMSGWGLDWQKQHGRTVSVSTGIEVWTAEVGSLPPSDNLSVVLGVIASYTLDILQVQGVNSGASVRVANTSEAHATGTSPAITFPGRAAPGDAIIVGTAAAAFALTTPATGWNKVADLYQSGPSVTMAVAVAPAGAVTSMTSTIATSAQWAAISIEVVVGFGGLSRTLEPQSGYDSTILADHPVLYVRGEQYDSAGNEHVVIAFNSPTIDGLPNGDDAFVYDGATNYLQISNAVDLSIDNTGQFSIEAWLRPDVIQFAHQEASGYVNWMGKGDLSGTSGNQEWLLRMYSLTNSENRPNRISGYAFNPAGGFGVGSNVQEPVSPPGEWIHIVLTYTTASSVGTDPAGFPYDHGGVKLYKNGTLEDQDAFDQLTNTPPFNILITPTHGLAPMRIATKDFVSFFQGAIGKVAIYNTVLSDIQVKNHFTAMVGPSVGLNGAIAAGGYVTDESLTIDGTTSTGDSVSGTISITGTIVEAYEPGGAGPPPPPPPPPVSTDTEMIRVVRELPPTRLMTSIETPSGKVFRWAEDEPRGQNVFSGLRQSSAAPGGFESLDCTLARDPRLDYDDLEPLSTIRTHGPGGEVAGEFRLEGVPATSGDQMAISPSAVGWQAHLNDREDCSANFIDRTLGNWGDISLERKTALFQGSYDPSAGGSSVISGAVATLALQIASLDQAASPSPSKMFALASARYLAALGTGITRIRSDYYNRSLGGGWAFQVWGSDITGNAVLSGPANLITDAVNSTDFTAHHQLDLICANTPAAMMQLYFTGAASGDTSWEGDFQNLRVFGTNIPIVNIAGGNAQTEGVYASDAILYIIAAFCPHFFADHSTVQKSTLVIPQLRFDMTTPGNMVNGCIAFGVPLPDWFVWEGKAPDFLPRFYVHNRGLRSRTWKARIGPTKLSETGPAADSLWNRVVISYSDVDGSDQEVTPNASDPYPLIDLDPSNPLNQAGLTRTHNLSMGITSTATIARQVGQTFLNEARQISRAGQATHSGYIEDFDTGILWPPWMMRAGDQVAYVDASDPSPRRITHVDYDNASRTATVQLDSPPDSMSGLLARLGLSIGDLALG